MDFNDIKSRLERVYASVNQRLEHDGGKSIKVERKYAGTKLESFAVTFDKDKNEPDTYNKIFTIIHNLANLKDHLKNILLARKENPNQIEDEINKSEYLKVILDLSNQEKHGYPLTKFKRSLKDPIIINISHGMIISAGSSSFSIDIMTGQSTTKNCPISIDADIVDSNNNYLFRLDQLIDNAILDWESIIKKIKIN